MGCYGVYGWWCLTEVLEQFVNVKMTEGQIALVCLEVMFLVFGFWFLFLVFGFFGFVLFGFLTTLAFVFLVGFMIFTPNPFSNFSISQP